MTFSRRPSGLRLAVESRGNGRKPVAVVAASAAGGSNSRRLRPGPDQWSVIRVGGPGLPVPSWAPCRGAPCRTAPVAADGQELRPSRRGSETLTRIGPSEREQVRTGARGRGPGVADGGEAAGRRRADEARLWVGVPGAGGVAAWGCVRLEEWGSGRSGASESAVARSRSAVDWPTTGRAAGEPIGGSGPVHRPARRRRFLGRAGRQEGSS